MPVVSFDKGSIEHIQLLTLHLVPDFIEESSYD